MAESELGVGGSRVESRRKGKPMEDGEVYFDS